MASDAPRRLDRPRVVGCRRHASWHRGDRGTELRSTPSHSSQMITQTCQRCRDQRRSSISSVMSTSFASLGLIRTIVSSRQSLKVPQASRKSPSSNRYALFPLLPTNHTHTRKPTGKAHLPEKPRTCWAHPRIKTNTGREGRVAGRRSPPRKKANSERVRSGATPL